MPETRTLQPDDRLAHYRVVGPLGVGGMGEVYLAQDETLERSVALKVLPRELVRHEDRVRRFQQEAKSASSLNHPNIVTIYEIGQDAVRSESGEESGPGPVHYISMELISGKTLSAKIHDEKTDLRTLLGYLAQAAEGVSKAHAAGIVHRDLKPGNIMVSEDGFAKVLDFGLAKLTERREPDNAGATAATQFGERTSEGAILGTVHYMSPEQVQGKSADHRADIFAFGCILYEAATRQRPFNAESSVETMHKILNDKPTPVEELNPKIPAELRRLIRRCLAKSPDQRLQSMKDVAIELREIVDEYDALSASATSGSGSAIGVAAPPRRRSMLPFVLGGVAVLAIAAVALWGLRRGERAPAEQPFQTMRITTQTNRGDVSEAALSPDGRYLAYITVPSSGLSGLRVNQVATGSDVEVLPPSDAGVSSPSFSPDGNYIYYRARKPDAPLYSALFQIPSLGGTPQERAFDVDSRVAFSPDGKRICFVRGIPQESRVTLVVRDLDQGQDRELASIRNPEVFSGNPSWSPDGKRVSIVVLSPPPDSKSTVALFDVDSGRRTDHFTLPNAFLGNTSWLADGAGIVADGVNLTNSVTNQVYLVTYPGAVLQRVTNDVNDYFSISAGPDAIAAVRSQTFANLWVADAETRSARQLTQERSAENSPFGLAVLNDDTVVFPATRGTDVGLWAIPMAGGNARRLPTGPGYSVDPQAGNGTIVFNRYESGKQFIWCVKADGTGLRQLTQAGGENLLGMSPDGRFVTHSDSARTVWIVSTETGERRALAHGTTSGTALFSPSGDRVLFTEYGSEGGLIRVSHRIVPAGGGDPSAPVPVPATALGVNWGPRGESLAYRDRADPAWNVFLQPLDGGPRRQVTRFTDGRIKRNSFSPDGTRLALLRESGGDENVWIANADGSGGVQVTDFKGFKVYDGDWTPDNRRVILRAGTDSRDAVLIRNFQ